MIIVQDSEDDRDDRGCGDDHMDDKGHLITDICRWQVRCLTEQKFQFDSEPMAGERMQVHVEFVDAEHVNHDITVTQNGKTVLDDMAHHQQAQECTRQHH